MARCLHCVISQALEVDARVRGVKAPCANESLAALAAVYADLIEHMSPETRAHAKALFEAVIAKRLAYLAEDAPEVVH